MQADPGFRLAIIAAPKAFRGHAGLIQRNAIASWRSLAPEVEILLGGDEEGLDAVAAEYGATRLGPLDPGVDGPPRVDCLVARARERSPADLFAYVNADIILMSDWLWAVRRAAGLLVRPFLAIGRRIDLDVETVIDFDDPAARCGLLGRARSEGRLAARVCKDYFVFGRDDYQHLPGFTLGRAYWDNWMVDDAHRRGLPVVDLTHCGTAIHQNHDYAHLAGGRLSAYLTSPGARANRRLAGGSRMMSGAVASCRLGQDGQIEQLRMPATIAFAADLPRFLGLTAAVAASGAARWLGWSNAQTTRLTGSPPRPRADQLTGSRPKIPSRQAA